ncbi:extracellular solute-binding protein [Actinophytocola xanthii]|uniref:Sugar ABC transporter substrate-binding protein n=1 Tax=Actinophytocola xanthii TaxID=1912961 RepID=A0A1Q8CLK8_9PSEU|nr:extracellular solute-binding protein [Actinophytocola xanthii]OLF15248.1 sugar ABC transporter substrate-binding protein [Actinophytocola xanthii]
MKRWTKAITGVAAVALATAGCAGSGGSGGGGDDAGQNEDRTLTVWLMNGSAPETLTDALHKEFEQTHDGVTVKYEVQEWNGIQDKLTTALGGQNPPDIIELGNTQAPAFASQEVLTDLSGDVGDLNGDQWLESLKASGEWDGKQYSTPFYAANREVLYRTDMFEQAGITAPPTSRQEWLDAITKLKAKFGSDPQFQALYLPGQNWYTLLSFIYDEGGDIAEKDGTKFTATLTSDEAKAGLEFYKQLVEASGTTAPKDNDEQTPEQAGIFGQGKVAMMIGLPWEVDTATKDAPDLKAKISGFPIPSKNAGETAPVFQGGSNLAIPVNSANADLAKDYLKLMLSSKYQTMLAEAGMVPGASTDLSPLEKNPVSKAMADASQNGRAVPATPTWATIEAGQNPLKDMLTAYLTGAKDLNQATADANAALDAAFSG